jgi:hypothetical protein
VNDQLPLAAASIRLRRRPGRPRKNGDSPVTPAAEVPMVTSADVGALASPAIVPRLLTVDQAAAYLGLGPDTVYELVTRGVLRRVRIPAPPTMKRGGHELRKILLDRQDLDAQIDAWRERDGL